MQTENVYAIATVRVSNTREIRWRIYLARFIRDILQAILGFEIEIDVDIK